MIPLGYTANRFDVPEDGVNSTNQQVKRIMLMANYDLGWGVLTSTTMIRQSTSTQNYSSAIDLGTETQFQQQGEVGVYPFGQVLTDVEDKTVYQDLHLTGSAFGDKLSWLTGGEVLWQRDHTLLNTTTNPCGLAVGAGICAGTPTAPTCYLVLPTSRSCPATYPAAFGVSETTPQTYLSEAVYGSLKYKLGRGFSLSGELRVTNDHKTASQYSYLLYTSTPYAKPSDYEFRALQPSYAVTLSYLIPGSWQDLLYVKTGSGYRAGGINAGTSTPVAPITFRPTYGDEDTTSYEIGVKGNLTPPVYFTFDGYFSRTTNAIASITDGCTVTNVCKQGPTEFNINAGTVRAYGVEAAIDGRFDVWGGKLNLGLNLADQRADYISLPSGYSGLPLLYSPVAQIPNLTVSSTFNYVHPIVDQMDAFINMVYNGQWGGGQDTVTAVVPFNALSDFNDVSLRAGVDYKKLQVALFVQNLTNETVALLKFQNVGVPLSTRYNEPRTIGVDLMYKW